MDTKKSSINLLFQSISQEVTHFKPLKHFAMKHLTTVQIAECERKPNRVCSLLHNLYDILQEDIIVWMFTVFSLINHSKVIKKIVEYLTDSGKIVNHFTVMLNEVAQWSETKDFENLKLLYHNEISDADLEEAKVMYDLFVVLQRCGKLDENKLSDFKDKLNSLDNKKMARIVDTFQNQQQTREGHSSNSMSSSGTRRNRTPVAEKIMMRLQTPQQVEQPAMLNGSQDLPRCTRPLTAPTPHGCGLSASSNIQQQMTGNVMKQNDYRIVDPEGDYSAKPKCHTDPRSANIRPTLAVQPLKCSQENSPTYCLEDQTYPKTTQGASVSPVQGLPSLELNLTSNVDTLTDSMEPKEVDRSETEDSINVLKRIADPDETTAVKGCLCAENLGVEYQCKEIQRKKAEDYKMLRVSSANERQVVQQASGEMTALPLPGTLNKIHADSPLISKEPVLPSRSSDDRFVQAAADERAEKMLREKKEHQKHLSQIKARLKPSWQLVTLYGYQKELAEPALEGFNCIMCAPTGSGKTLTAAYICYEKRRKALDAGEQFKALFIVCIRNLVDQQKEEIMKMFSKEENSNKIVASINDTVKLNELLQDFDIVVLTAQILLNSLKNNEVYLDDFQLLILDECHHTNLGHPYNVIMQIYHKLKREGHNVPQVVGLTASLGVGDKDDPVDHYISMCANLSCSCITHVRNSENKRELLEHNPPPEKNQIISVDPRDPSDMFVLIITYIMKEIETLTKHLTPIRGSRGSQKYENWMVEMRAEAETKHFQEGIFNCQTLLVLNHALMYYDELRGEEILPLLKSYFDESKRAVQPSSIRQKIYNLFDRNISELIEIASVEKLEDNPKLVRLCQLLTDLYLTNPESKGILLTKTRFCVEGLVSFIKKQDLLKNRVKCAKFVGQGRGDGFMTDAEQKLILACFRLDSNDPDAINLLVATDVAQEGLDMPQCNFVIRYNFVSNEIGSVQSRGRARAKNSECYLIVNKGSINEIREYQNLGREHAMMEALDEIDLLDEEVLQKRIEAKQKMLSEKKEAKARQKPQYDVNHVTIHCKGCKQLLCMGRDLRQRGSNYIVICPEFEEKITIKKKTKPLVFRYDSHIAYTFCAQPSCNHQLGPKLQYNSGRQYGYALSREAVMWKMHDWTEYRHIKQWSKVPFYIEEEPI